MTPASKRGIIVAGCVALGAFGVGFWPESAAEKRGARDREQPSSARRATDERPPRAPRTRPRLPTPAARATHDPVDTAAAAPITTAAASARQPSRASELQIRVMQEAVRHDWVTLDEHDNPCPPERIRVVYDAPGDLQAYTKGAYFEPLGPAPGDATDEVNGLLLCEGSSFLYRGFEAYWRADRGQWDVFPFPVIE